MTNLRTTIEELEHVCELSFSQVRELFEVSDQIFYVFNMSQKTPEYITPNSAKILGMPLEKIYHLNILEELESRVHPDYHEMCMRCLEKLAHPGHKCTIEYQWKDMHGKYRWMREHCKSHQDSTTGEIYVTGAARDVTEEVQNREQLRDIKAGRPSLLTSIHPKVREMLTRTENTILEMIIEGNSNKVIAKNLHRSVRTVEDHRNHIMHKLGVHNVVELLKAAAGIKH